MSAERPNLPHPDVVTNNQVTGLLQIIHAMSGALAAGGETEPTLPGEARAAAELTFWKACDKLQEIIADRNRWNMKFQHTLEARADSLFKQQQEFLNAQIAASQEISKPHFKYRPEMRKMQGGNWICYVGDLNAPQEGNCIVGVGATPAAAVEAFDEQFYGTITPFMQQWLAQREAEQSQTPNEQQTNELDPGTDSQASGTPQGGQDH